MSLHDYHVSGELERSGVPFLACLMAAMRRADSDNYRKLAAAFPDVAQELEQRYIQPNGLLQSEQDWESFEKGNSSEQRRAACWATGACVVVRRQGYSSTTSSHSSTRVR